MPEPTLQDFEAQIGYRFVTPQYLLEALTHSSYAREACDPTPDNEQLEFLGDAILSLVVSLRLVEVFPDSGEGKLSRARAHLVSAVHLGRVAAKLRLGDYLRLGRGEEKTGGRNKLTLLADALEALVAAIYRDSGLAAAQAFIERHVLPPDLSARADELFSADYKSALQEYLQAEHLPAADYRVVDERGPEHQRTFTVEVVAGENQRARGWGTTKKAAEQEAARNVLEKMMKKTESYG